MLGGKKI